MVGGKTGTSEKLDPDGGYFKDRNLATFAATFPVHDPKYVLVVLIDEPKGQKHSYGYATGGWVAAPAAKRIIEKSAPLLGINKVDERSAQVKSKLNQNIIVRSDTSGFSTDDVDALPLEEPTEDAYELALSFHQGTEVERDYQEAEKYYRRL